MKESEVVIDFKDKISHRAKGTRKKCVIDECENLSHARGLCQKHYNKHYKRHFDTYHPETKMKYYYSHREEILEKEQKRRDENPYQQIIWRQRLKLEVMSHYSKGLPHCNYCGFDDIRALCIDHIENNGSSHRKEVGGSSTTTYIWLKKRHYPNGFQVLCENCNRIKEHERKNKEKEMKVNAKS